MMVMDLDGLQLSLWGGHGQDLPLPLTVEVLGLGDRDGEDHAGPGARADGKGRADVTKHAVQGIPLPRPAAPPADVIPDGSW